MKHRILHKPLSKCHALAVLAFLSFPLYAQKPIVSYTFEKGMPSDDAGLYTGDLAGGAQIITMSDNNHVLDLGDSNGYMDLGAAMGKSVLSQLGENFTFTCNVFVPSTDNALGQDGNFVFCLGDSKSTSNPQNYYIVRLRNGVVGFTFRYGGTNYRGSADISIETGKWQTVTYVRQGNKGAFYLNGVKRYDETLSGNGLLTPAQAVARGIKFDYNYLGLSPWNGNVFLKGGKIDNFAIYDHALSEAEVTSLHATAAKYSSTPKGFEKHTERYRLLRSSLALAGQIQTVNAAAKFEDGDNDLLTKGKEMLTSETGSLQQADSLARLLYGKAQEYLTPKALSQAPKEGFNLTAAIENPFFYLPAVDSPGTLNGWKGVYTIACAADTIDGMRDAFFASRLENWNATQTLTGLPNGIYRLSAKALKKNHVRKFLIAQTDSVTYKTLLCTTGTWSALLPEDTLNTVLDSIYVTNGKLTIGFQGDNSTNTAYADEVQLFLLAPVPDDYTPKRDTVTTLLPGDKNLPTEKEIINLITRINDSWIERYRPLGNYCWNKAVYMNGNIEAMEFLKDKDPDHWLSYRRYALEWSQYNKWNEGQAPLSEASKWKFRGGTGYYNVLFGDNQICFQTYIDLANSYQEDIDDEYLADYNGDGNIDKDDMTARAREVMAYQISTNENRYWWWTDALYMMVPTMSHMYNLTKGEEGGGVAYLAATQRYLDYTRAYMYDEENNLFFRDSTYVYPKHASGNGLPNYWSRSEGWALAGLARALREIPAGEAHYDYLMQLYKEGVEALIPWMQVDADGNGYWTQSICDPDFVPGYETSGTALDIYALLIGLRMGWIDAPTYYPVVKRGWDYLVNVALQGMDTDKPYVGYAQPIGAAATQTVSATSEQDFATGAFLECAVEMARYAAQVRESESTVKVKIPVAQPQTEKVNVYTTEGVLLRQQVKPTEATEGLPKGIYIVGHKKIVIR